MSLDRGRRRFLAAGGTGIAAALAGCTGAVGGGSRGDSSGGLRLETVDAAGSPGGTVGIDPPGTVVLLDFFATWCAPCKPEMANLRAARERFGRDEVFMVSITQETDRAAIADFWERYEGTWPAAMDADLEATEKYGVTGIPTIIVLTPDGERVMRHTGLAGEEKIVAGVEKALEAAGTG